MLLHQQLLNDNQFLTKQSKNKILKDIKINKIGFRPNKVIICENVKGLSMDYARDHLNKMVNDFEALGYSVTWKVMKGHEHGVPQKRERVIIVGTLSKYNAKYKSSLR